MSYILLVAGLVLLVIAGDLLVRGSVALADRLNIPPIIIGLTVVAFGTSAPELVICIKAALAGSPGIAVGNVVGSNIANILLVLGIPALIAATDCNQPFVVRNTLFMLGASIVFVALCFTGPLGAVHGAILLGLLAVFLFESGRRAMKSPASSSPLVGSEDIDGIEGVPHSGLVCTLFVIAGVIGLPIGAHLTVTGASGIATDWGVSDAVIGLTVVAIGTSLPELVATIMAAMRRQGGLAIGNVLGSNMFNILAIMGITTMVAEVDVPIQMLTLDLWVMLATALVLTPFVLWRRSISARVGAAFVVAYAAYVVVLYDPGLIDVATAR